MLSSSDPFTNCAAIDPVRPAAATTPIPDALTAVGNASVETTPKAFHPQVLKALKRQAPIIITVAPAVVPKAKRVAAAAASAIDQDRRGFRPTFTHGTFTSTTKGTSGKSNN